MLLHNVNIKQRVALKYYTMQLNTTSALDYYEYCDPKTAEQESGGKIITNKGLNDPITAVCMYTTCTELQDDFYYDNTYTYLQILRGS